MSAVTNRLDVAAVRADFPALHQNVHGHPLVYLDSAATAQRPRAVLEAVRDFYESDNANVHRGIYELGRRATERHEAARATVARFLNARDDSEVVWVRGTTEAINLVASTWGASNLRPGDEVVLTVLEHHSNLVPWQLVAKRTGARLRYVDIDDQGRLRLDQLDEIVGERTRLIAVGHVSNALGTIHPVRDIAAIARRVGALLLVDGAQGAPHLPVDVQALGCDFYAFSGHKVGAPMGIGALWARRELLDAMPPYQGGGEMIDVVELDHCTYAEPPHRFEAGTPNVSGAIGLAAAIEYLRSIGHDAILEHERELIVHGLSRLQTVPGLRLFGPRDPEARTSVFAFDLEGIHPHD
ncbi:MAG TPA: SufS family cysteine desulfurase, partial [Longimicrobiales bacterium]|nr:SufS family cysteine desulfurase [Longimicrobiales bacterium]